MPRIKVGLTNEQIEYLMDLVENEKSKYKTQEEWQNSKEFSIIEELDDMNLAIFEMKERKVSPR